MRPARFHSLSFEPKGTDPGRLADITTPSSPLKRPIPLSRDCLPTSMDAELNATGANTYPPVASAIRMRKSCSQLRNASQATARRGSRSDIQVWFDWCVSALPYHVVCPRAAGVDTEAAEIRRVGRACVQLRGRECEQGARFDQRSSSSANRHRIMYRARRCRPRTTDQVR